MQNDVGQNNVMLLQKWCRSLLAMLIFRISLNSGNHVLATIVEKCARIGRVQHTRLSAFQPSFPYLRS